MQICISVANESHTSVQICYSVANIIPYFRSDLCFCGKSSNLILPCRSVFLWQEFQSQTSVQICVSVANAIPYFRADLLFCGQCYPILPCRSVFLWQMNLILLCRSVILWQMLPHTSVQICVSVARVPISYFRADLCFCGKSSNLRLLCRSVFLWQEFQSQTSVQICVSVANESHISVQIFGSVASGPTSDICSDLFFCGYSSGFSGVSTTSPILAPGHQVSQSAT